MVKHVSRLFAALLIVFALVGASESRAQFGVAAGLNFESFDDLDIGSSSATFENASGYHIGVFYDLGLGPAGIRLGAFYRDIDEVDVTVSGVGESFSLNMIDVPLDLRFNLTATPLIRPYVLAGPVFSFPSTDNDEFDDELKNVTVSGTVGAGLALSLGGVTLFPELRYGIGVSRFMENSVQAGGFSFESSDEQRLNTVKLRLGVRF